MRREALHLAVDREFVQRLLATGRAFNLERGGLYDARSGVVNVWAKRRCWSLGNCFTFAGWVSESAPLWPRGGSATNRDRHRRRVQPAASGEQAPPFTSAVEWMET